jgi:anti-sigma factor RsiW
MACERWRGQLDAYVDGELPLPDADALYSHLRECAACAAEALERVQMKRSVAVAGTRYQPSAAFREKVRKGIASNQRTHPRWAWTILAVPALSVLVVSIVVYMAADRDKARRHRVYSELADLHVSALASASPVDVVSTDRHTVKPWFAGKIPFTFNLPELQGTDFTLVGGRVTYLEQTPGAQLIYQIRKHEISVFIFQDRGDQALTVTSTPINALSFNAENWSQNGLRYYVIGDVSATDIRALSDLLRNAK